MECLLYARRDGVAVVSSMMGIGLMASGSLLFTAEWQDQSTPPTRDPLLPHWRPPSLARPQIRAGTELQMTSSPFLISLTGT